MNDLICELVKEDDPFLRETPEVFNFENPQVDPEKLEKLLIDNMIHHRGIGLSANQIGIPVKVFAMAMDNNIIVVFNPEILELSDETTYIREGCLSFPDDSVVTERFTSLTVIADNHEQPLNFSEENLLECVCVQHEIDHLNGITMFDRQYKK